MLVVEAFEAEFAANTETWSPEDFESLLLLTGVEDASKFFGNKCCSSRSPKPKKKQIIA